MTLSRRKSLLIVWALCIIGAGFAVASTSGYSGYGVATSLAILGVSLGVPLTRAFTEFSK